MKEDEFTSYLEFESEDGETITLAVLDYFTYKDELYALLCDDCDCDDDECECEESDEIYVLKVIEGEDGEEFVEPDDDIFPELEKIVGKILDGEYDTCCDDDDCDCGHHHMH